MRKDWGTLWEKKLKRSRNNVELNSIVICLDVCQWDLLVLSVFQENLPWSLYFLRFCFGEGQRREWMSHPALYGTEEIIGGMRQRMLREHEYLSACPLPLTINGNLGSILNPCTRIGMRFRVSSSRS